MKASPADQRQLLDLVDIERRLASAVTQRKNPPQAARISELSARRTTESHELTVRMGARDDAATELCRLENDVETARARRNRDQERLQSAGAKDAVSLEREIESLDRRLDTLETTQLEAMERLEAAEAAAAAQQEVIAAINAEGAKLTAEAKSVVADATTLVSQLERDRAAVAGGLPDVLLAQYERIARNTVGAGLLRGGMCEACRVILSGSDLAEVRAAAADDVVLCPECGAILVRAEESGL